VAEVVTSMPLPPVLFSSFHPPFVWWLARHVPDVPRAWLVHEKQRILKYAPGSELIGANGVHPEHVLATAERVARLKRTGHLVNVWTVNTPARARELARFGVDAIISDVPGEILHGLV
jgi:glycerophosphoryl diester phosphodiesterase